MIRFAALIAVLALVGAAGASASTITQQTATKSYELILDVGPLEAMYTPAQVKAKHPMSGEITVGSPMGGGGMSMGTGNDHLEVHITSRATEKVVANVMPTIELRDTTAMSNMAMPVKVPVVEMEGVGAGAKDFHYGNNVKLIPGHAYR